MTSVSERSLRRRQGRYALTAVGIALGVGIVFAVVLTSAATTRAFDRFVNGFAGEADVVASPPGTFDSALPPEAVRALSNDPEVDVAVGRYAFRSARDLRGDDVDFREFVSVQGFDFDRASSVHEFDLAAGRFPQDGRAEVMVAPTVDAALGETVTLATSGGRRPVRVVGVLEERGAALAEGGRVLFTTIDAARRLQGVGADVTILDLVLEPGVDAAEWIEERREKLGAGVILQEASDLSGFFRDFLASVQAALTITAAIALFVGAFLIFLTFSVAVAERTRFFGTLRALGALPGQVRRLVVGEGLLLGVVSAALGLAIGYLISLASIGAVRELLAIGDVSIGDPLVPAVVSVVLGVGVSLLASLVPARRAASLSPVAAMRDEAVDGRDRVRAAPRILLLAGGVATSLVSGSAAVRALGALLILLGGVLVVPLVLRPLAGLLGRFTGRVAPGVGEIAVAHLVKERSRSAYTLALLMVVMASVIAIGASNLSMSDTLDEVVERQFGSDLQISAPNSFEPGFGETLEDVDGVASVSPMRFGSTDIVESGGTRDTFLFVIDPATYFDLSSFPWELGDDASVQRALGTPGNVVAAHPIAEELGIGLGDEFEVQTVGGVRGFTLVGTYTVLGFNEGIVVNETDGAALFGARRPMAYLVDLEDGVDADAGKAAIGRRLLSRYDYEIETAADVKEFAQGQLSGFFGIGYAVLLVSIVIGVLGLANTLVVSVIQRTREIGILRSSGVLRGQLRTMVLAESGTLVLVAWLLCLPLGWLLTRVTIQAFADSLGFTVAFLWPWVLVPPLFGLALLAGALAAIGPARRAARLDPVVALRFD